MNNSRQLEGNNKFSSLARRLKHDKSLRQITAAVNEDMPMKNEQNVAKRNSKFEVLRSDRFSNFVKQQRNPDVIITDLERESAASREFKRSDSSISNNNMLRHSDNMNRPLSQSQPFLNDLDSNGNNANKSRFGALMQRAAKNELEMVRNDPVPKMDLVRNRFKNAIQKATREDLMDPPKPRGWAAVRRSNTTMGTTGEKPLFSINNNDYDHSSTDGSDFSSVSRINRKKYAPRLRLRRGHTCRDIVTQLFVLWEPQCAESYREGVKYIPPQQVDKDNKLRVSDLAFDLMSKIKTSSKEENTDIQKLANIVDKMKSSGARKNADISNNITSRLQSGAAKARLAASK